MHGRGVEHPPLRGLGGRLGDAPWRRGLGVDKCQCWSQDLNVKICFALGRNFAPLLGKQILTNKIKGEYSLLKMKRKSTKLNMLRILGWARM